jgi:two-component sensor histidine kinase
LLDTAKRALQKNTTQRQIIQLKTTFGKNVNIECFFAPIIREGACCLMFMMFDITERIQAEEALLQREKYLSGLNDSAETLLILTDEVPYQAFVDKLGPGCNVSRVYIFLNHLDSNGRLSMYQKVEWCADGVHPEIDNPQLQNLPYDVWLPHWKDTLAQGKIINGLVSDFPAVEREILKPQGILTILVIPIIIDSEFAGFIGFDNCVSEQEWDIVAQTFLRNAANDLAQAIKRKRSEEQVKASLIEKEVLLREVHHRVKNNMQVIVSLMRKQTRRSRSDRMRNVFDDCRDRINAMSLIHEALYQSENLARIDFENYIKKLCRNLNQAYNAYNRGILVTVKQCNVTLGIDRGIAVGMVICELISNSFKHAFPLYKGGNVSISLSGLAGNEVELIVQDNGKGLPPEIDIQNTSSLGLKLAVAAVTRELGESIEVERSGGTRFIIRFKYKNK